MDKVKVGFIGAGGLANAMHYPSLHEFEDAEIVAMCDLSEERLRSTAEKFEVEKTYSDYRKMLDEVDVDAVYVIMPPHHLFDIAIDCLNRKLDVFIEKPPGVTTYQTRAMAMTAEKNDCKTMVAFNRRYIPLMIQVKEIIEERGPIIQCTATFMKNHLKGSMYYNGATDVLTCDAIHAVDTLRWMGGEMERLASDINSFHMDFCNSFNVLIKFENGASGFLVTNWAVGKRIHTFEMHAKGISAFLDPDDSAAIYKDNSEDGQVITAVEAAGSDERHKSYGFFAENRHFIDCVKEGKQPQTCFDDAVKTMELVDRIYAGQI